MRRQTEPDDRTVAQASLKRRWILEEGLNSSMVRIRLSWHCGWRVLEQPAVDLLTLVTAGGYRIGKGRLVKLLEIGSKPQLQRMYRAI